MLYLIAAALVILCAQAVKAIVRASLIPGESIHVIGDFFRITYINNPGAALGLFSGSDRFLIVIPAVIVVLVMGFIYLHKYTHPLVKYALTLIAAGGVGNLIDRIVFGQVTDMFSFRIFPPVFNVADIAVTAGCAMIFVYVLFGERMHHEEKKGRAASSKD